MSDGYYRTLGIRMFRGIGEKPQFLTNLKKLNLFIGQNNTGKSTVLTMISKYLPITKSGASWKTKRDIEDIDFHKGNDFESPELWIGIHANDIMDKIVEEIPTLENNRSHITWLKAILQHIAGDDGNIWWSLDLQTKAQPYLMNTDPAHIQSLGFHPEWVHLQSALTPWSGGDLASATQRVLEAISNRLSLPTKKSHLIPAIRQIGGKETHFDLGDMTGSGLINRLADLQNPNLENLSDRDLFAKINEFLQSVTGEASARIDIPNSQDYILVHMNGRVLPLSSLGTGIHEIIMIASFCTLISNEVVCIEEPEIHLHPVLQKKLIRYLSEQTENQYFIATHSASLIDTIGASIHHVQLEDDITQITEAVLDEDRYQICADLGHKASDLVQTNVIIWVEGPSDRIYINAWLNQAQPEFVEGLHYSVMFYGGRLLSHLTASDDEVEEFINLRKLNRNMVIVMDSDRETPRKGVNATKRRISKEFNEGGGIAWLTKGREIENYLEPAKIQSALSSIYEDSYVGPGPRGDYEHPLNFIRVKKSSSKGRANELFKKADKVKVARHVVQQPLNLGVLDLKERIGAIVDLIESVNQI